MACYGGGGKACGHELQKAAHELRLPAGTAASPAGTCILQAYVFPAAALYIHIPKPFRLNRALLLLVLCLPLAPGFAQTLKPFPFAHFTMQNGLASNEVNSVVQDTTGYLWIGTNNGLQRFDGVQFKTFRHRRNDPLSIPENDIHQVLADGKGRLWLRTGKGTVGVFDRNRFSFRKVPVLPRNDTALQASKHLMEDEAGNLFLLLGGWELLAYDARKRAFTPEANFIPLQAGWRIVGMAQQPGTRKYWVSLFGKGMAIYNHQTGNWSHAADNHEQEAAVAQLGGKLGVQYPFFDRQGRFWFQNWDTGGFPFAMRYDTRKKERPLQTYEFITTLKTYNEINGFMQQRDGRVWIRGLQLLGYFQEKENRFHLIPNDARNPDGIAYERVNTLFEDRERNLWVGTQNFGLYRYNPAEQYFTNFSHQHPVTGQAGEGAILSFVETRNGDLLVASWGDGLFRYDPQMQRVPLGIRDLSNRILTPTWSLCASADSNTIWIGCQPGVYRYDQRAGTMQHRNPPILKDHTVRQLVEDQAGNLWLGMHGFGVYRWKQPGKWHTDSVVHVPETGKAMINVLYADKQGWIWVGSGNKGLYVYEGGSARLLRHWSNGNGFTSEVCGVSQYNDSMMVVAGTKELYWYNRRHHRLQQIPLPNDLMGTVTALQTDRAGYVWISTTNALYRYQPVRKALVWFNRQDGITNDHFTLGASYRMRDGRMLMGNSNAFISFRPAAINIAPKPPRVVFTGIQAGKRELPTDSVLALPRLALNARSNSINISFSSLTYTGYYLIQYKMEGLDDEWQFADRDHRASFPFLPPGKYTLLLRAMNAEGVPASQPTVLHLQVLPPFYQTWWFFTLLGLALAGILYILDRQRMRRKKALEKVRTDIANGLHQEVNTALNNINILSEIARLKQDREPERAREYLEQIHTKSHNMIIAMDDMLWSLDPENDNMMKTVNRIREFAEALTQRHGVVIDLLIDKRVEKLELDMKLRHEAFLLFKEGLRSLVAAGTPHCIVNISLDKAKLLFTIEFVTEGCNMQQLTNLLHRRDMDARISSLRARLQVQVHKSRSMFMLQLPLGN